MSIDELISYLPCGTFHVLKEGKPYRRIFPDDEGYLKFFKKGKKYKLKANKVAWELTHKVEVPSDKVILHKNLDPDDYRLQNLRLVSRAVNNSIKEAQRNLSGSLKLFSHPVDAFAYILLWRDNGKDKSQVIQDIVVARKLFSKLQLKYAKILSKYCVFDL